jgi:hypothetical protein
MYEYTIPICFQLSGVTITSYGNRPFARTAHYLCTHARESFRVAKRVNSACCSSAQSVKLWRIVQQTTNLAINSCDLRYRWLRHTKGIDKLRQYVPYTSESG